MAATVSSGPGHVGNPSTSDAPPLRGAATIISLLYLAYLVSFADRVIFGMSLKPIKAALEFSDSQLGLLSGAAFAISYAVFSPVGGWIVDRLRRRTVLFGALSFFSAMTLLTAFSRSLGMMALARIGVGVGESFISPLAVSLISDVVPRERRARTFALYLSAGAVGSLLALLLGGIVLHALTGTTGFTVPGLGRFAPWQGLFTSAAMFGFALAAVSLVLMPEPVRTAQVASSLDVHGFEDSRMFIRRYWLLVVAIFAGMSLFTLPGYTYNAWGILFFERVHGWSPSQASVLSAVTTGVTLLVGCLSTGPVIEALRRSGRRDAPLRVGLAAGLGFVVCGTAGVLAPSPYLALALMTLASLFGYTPAVCIYACVGDIVPAATRGRFAAVHTLTIGIIANALGPLLVGLFNDHLFASSGEGAIRLSLAALFVLAGLAGTAVTLPGLRLYRRRVAEIPA